jgi:hypothetical protein
VHHRQGPKDPDPKKAKANKANYGFNIVAAFAEGRMYERGLISWIREHSGSCKDLNRNRGGSEKTPNAVQNCGGSAWFTAGLTEEAV